MFWFASAVGVSAVVLFAAAEGAGRPQLADLCTRLGSRCAGFLQMAPGPLDFVHARVSRAALSQFRRAETALARRAIVDFATPRR